ncbi:MAG TPA: serine/threonine-protein kinase [Polyangiaceae bacterium]|nr:serine/threonine-protein kinase [Polyangiaceae bacterium]
MARSTSSRPPSLPPGIPAPGQVLAGKYTVERVIGVGGMGVVLAARHVELDERVAIKMLLPTLSPLGEPATRFVREARAAIKIRNEHVVRVLDVGRLEGGAPYIVMEYLEGSDLSRLVEDIGPLKVEDAVEYVVQACEAIAAAHALGIVHRDLKPANLFLARTGDGRACVKVLDFGISKIAEGTAGSPRGLTSTSAIMGTPCFMSPEQLRSTRDVDARADIWSIGAILHALLTGDPPYDGESNADVSAKIIRDAPTPIRQIRPEVPQEVEDIILRCLEKDPAARFGDVAELANALAGVTKRESIKASAARVSRGAAGVAPTLMSRSTDPPRAEAPPSAPVGPTRTASAWGETGRHDVPQGRGRTALRVGGMLLAAAALVAIGAVGVTRLQRQAPAAAAAGSSIPVPPSFAVTTPVPESSAPPAPPPSATTSAAAAAASSAAAPPGRPAIVRRAPIASSSAAPPAAPKPTTGLFDGRE